MFGPRESTLALLFCHSHRCTRVKNPGEGVLEVFAKIPRGSRLSGKNARGAGGPPISGFIAFL